MIDLVPKQVQLAFRDLFPHEGYTFRRCFAVLDGTSGGRILTDDFATPSWGAVHELSGQSTLFLAGSLDRALVAEIIETLRKDRIVTVGLDESNPLFSLLPDNPTHEEIEIEFEDRDPQRDLEALTDPPPHLQLVRIDRALEPRCIWTPWMFVDGASAVDLGIGYCLLDEGRIVSEGYAGPAVDGVMEMAVITDEAYRTRGLGNVVAARTVLECERLGYQTWWETSLGNIGSTRIARALGYRSEKRYRTLVWAKATEAV